MATKVEQIYFAETYGNKVQIFKAGRGQLMCSGQPMKLVAEK